MKRIWLSIRSTLMVLATGSLLTGCGIAETGAAAGAGAAAQIEQARQAKQTEERVRQQVDAAYQQSAEQLRAAEAASR